MMRSTLSPRCLSSFLLSALGGLLLLASGCGEDPNHDWDPMASQPDELVPPRNWTYLDTTAAPTLLAVKANSNKSSGTSNDITLSYRNKTATYSCTITASISDGGSQSCVPTQSSSETSPSPQGDWFYVKYADKTNSSNNSDGLLITALTVTTSGVAYELSSFSKGAETVYGAFSCTGCGGIFNDEDCNSCWIDGDDHNGCLELKTDMSADSVIRCVDY